MTEPVFRSATIQRAAGAERVLDVVASTDTVDSYGDSIDQGSWKLARYAANSTKDHRPMSTTDPRIAALEAVTGTKAAEDHLAAINSIAAEKAARTAAEAERDDARSIAAMHERERDRAVQERESFSLRASAVERERDEARQERDAAFGELDAATNGRDRARHELAAALARPTYEARETAPTPEERVAHEAAGARWLRCGCGRASVVCVYRTTDTGSRDGLLWIPIGADGLPCAWPVVAAEVTP